MKFEIRINDNGKAHTREYPSHFLSYWHFHKVVPFIEDTHLLEEAIIYLIRLEKAHGKNDSIENECQISNKWYLIFECQRE